MPTLIVRTSEPLTNIFARLNSGDWILTDMHKITSLLRGGILEVHPLQSGDPYDRILRANITGIVPLPIEPRRKVIHFELPVWVAPPPIMYNASWVVKYIP
jgi:hypothetical protein